MKNILIISNNFTHGGLETQIYSFYNNLKDKVNFSFIFGNYSNDYDFGNSSVYTIAPFGENSSINQFKNTVKEMVEIIKKEEIDVIHVHPFYYVLPAVFASQITNVPICYTYHGFGSVSWPYNINSSLLFNYALNELFAKIFFVYDSIEKYYSKTLRSSDTCFLEQPIDLSKFNKCSIANNGRWAFISRIDDDKYDSIIDIVNNIDNLNISELYFFGDGTKLSDLKQYIKRKKLSKRIFFKGFQNDLYGELKDGYNGIIGMGRCAAEGIALRLPVLLAGYGKIFGVIDSSNYEIVKNNNFAPIFLNTDSLENIGKKIDKINHGEHNYVETLYKKFDNDCASINVSKKYFEQLSAAKFVHRNNVVKLWNEISYLDSEEVFSNAYSVTQLISTYIKNQSLDLDLNNSLNIYNNIMSNIFHQNEGMNKLLGEKENLENRIFYLENNIVNLENKISGLENTVNNLNNLNNDLIDKYNNITFASLLKKQVKNIIRKQKPEIIAVLNVFNEELNIKNCIKHMYKYVNKIVVFDDGSTDNTVSICRKYKKVTVIENHNKKEWKERYNRETSLRKAYEIAETEFPWVLCVDADELFETKFLKNLNNICLKYSGTNKVLTVHFREMWNDCNHYRTDGIWGKKEKGLLFQLCKNMTFGYAQEHHIPWAYKEIVNNREILNYNLYHLKMIKKSDRIKRKNLYNKLDPEKKMQPIGYDYLCDENNIELVKIAKKDYNRKYVSKYYKQEK